MHEPLLALVKECLLPMLKPLDFEVVHRDEATSFDNATVTLQGPDLRIRIVRERSRLFISRRRPQH
jgi:hypothetical protein